jgi:hypothetical protein
MFLNPRSNLFNFQFTKDFMTDEIRDKYFDYLNKVKGFPIKEPLDFINYSIQGITLPGLNSDLTEQSTMYGRKKTHRNSIHPEELKSKEMTVTFRMFDGFANYWMMFDLMEHYYSYQTSQRYIPDQRVQILDGDGFVITEIELKRILYTSISDLSLNFSANVPEFTTFDITLIYNDFNLTQKFDSTY